MFKSLATLWRFRMRLVEGVLQDVRQRYVGSVFGALWVVLFPALQLSIYTVLYSVIFRIRPPGLDELSYVVLIFSGLVPLLAFGEAIQASTSSLSTSRALLMNAVFPAELIPLRAALSAHAPSLFGLGITLLAGFALGRSSWITLALVPVFWVLILMFAVGLGWVLSLLSLVARDVQHSLSLVVMMMFMLSPFAYTPEMVPSALRIIIYFNPLSYFVLCFQSVICYGTWPQPLAAVGAVVLAATAFFGGLSLFHRAKSVFFDYV